MTVTKYYKNYKVRLFPTQEQEELMWKHIHACRFIWNHMLEYHEEQYKKYHVNKTKYDMQNYITQLRKTDGYEWLKEFSLHSLTLTAFELSRAYNKFFKKACKHPQFKSKKVRKHSYPIPYTRVTFKNNTVRIPMIGYMPFKSSLLDFLGKKLINPRVFFINNKWILGFCIESESQANELTNNSLGIDLGIDELAVCSFGGEKIVFHNINKSKRVRKLKSKLKHFQRKLSKIYRTCKKDKNGNLIKSKNILKKEKIVREIYAKLTNIRHNYIHQVTHKIIMMRPKRIVMENLAVQNLIMNKYLHESIKECKWAEFILQVKYKCIANEIEFIQVDRFYPSSKTCSCCGNIKKDLKLSHRIYVCPKCGLVMDRDFNAARNLENYVLKQQ